LNSINELAPLRVAQDAWEGKIKEEDARQYLLGKSPREILEFQNHFPPNQHATSRWFQTAKVILDIRLAEIATESANKIVHHTDILTKQTEINIQYSAKLTLQTDTLLSESKKLGRLTWALILLTVVLAVLTAGLLYIDWHKEHEKPQQNIVWYPASQVLTNLDSPVIKLDAAPITGSLTIKAECPTNPTINFEFYDYYISNNSVVLRRMDYETWHVLLHATNLQTRIHIYYASVAREQR